MKKLLLLSCLLLIGCGQSQDQNEKWIKEIIATGLSERGDVLQAQGDVFSDYKVYRDGNNDGVCYEYIFADDPSEDLSADAFSAVRGELIGMVRDIVLDDPGLKLAMEHGVYLRFIYRAPGGRAIADEVVTSSDL